MAEAKFIGGQRICDLTARERLDELDKRLGGGEKDSDFVNSIKGGYSPLPLYGELANYSMSATGTPVADSQSIIKKYAVTAGDTLYLKLSADSAGVYQFQNSALFPVGNVNPYIVGETVTTSVNGFVTVPTGATYLIVSQLKSNSYNWVARNIIYINTDVLTTNELLINILADAEWENGSIYSVDGHLIVNSNRIRTVAAFKTEKSDICYIDDNFSGYVYYFRNIECGESILATDVLTNGLVLRSGVYAKLILFNKNDNSAPIYPASGYAVKVFRQIDIENKKRFLSLKASTLNSILSGIAGVTSEEYYSLAALKERYVANKPSVTCGFLYTQSAPGKAKMFYASNLHEAPTQVFTWQNATIESGSARVFAVSPAHGDIITLVNNLRNTPVVYDISESLEVVVSGLDVNPIGWLSTGGFDFGTDDNNNEYLIFGEYTGQVRSSSATGDYYYIRLWKASYPYTNASNWKVVYQAKRSSNYMSPADDGIPWHMHTCQRDPYTGIWYATTGDADNEILWMYSIDHGETWTQFHTGNVWESQVARVINFVFTEDYIYWANDAAMNHCVSRVSRDSSGLMDINSYVKLADLALQSTYNTCYMEYPRGLFMWDRRDATGPAKDTGMSLVLQFYDIETGEVHDLIRYNKLGTTQTPPYGFRNRCAMLRQAWNDSDIACGFENTNTNLINMPWNDESRMWTVKINIT